MRENKRMNNYHIEILQPNDGFKPNVHYAHAFGDLDTIAYVGKKAIAAIEGVQGNIVLILNEVDSIGGQAIREVVGVTANAKVVATVLKGELTTERKAAKSAPAETPVAEDIPEDESLLLAEDPRDADPNY